MRNHIKMVRNLISNSYWVASSLVTLSILVGWISYHNDWQADLTQNQRNSLSVESIKVLENLPDTIEIKALSSNSPASGKYFRKSISSFISRYQQYKANITLSFIDPSHDSKDAMVLGLKHEGDIIISYKNRQEHFTLPYTEERLTNLFIKLSASKKLSFFFTAGHQEPKLTDESLNGWSQFARALNNSGMDFKQSSNLNDLTQQQILVINAPHEPFNASELKMVKTHINMGGNLIWFIDQPNLQGLNELLSALNLEVSQGINVDLSDKGYGFDPKLVSASSYAKHEMFNDFILMSFFPSAHRISQKSDNAIWKMTQLIGVAENGWLTKTEPQSLASEELVKNIERHGPNNIGMALEHTDKKKLQRILVFGNSAFLSNSTISKGGNLQLGVRLTQWISSNYSPISVPFKLTKDSIVLIPNTTISKYLILAVFNGFQFILPVSLICVALLVLRRKSRF